jgi:hypothetical protein
MTETQRKAFDAFTASAKAWFTMEAERLGWHTMENITCVCKTYAANLYKDVEDAASCIDAHLVLDIGVFHDCSRTPTASCDGCSEVESIQYCIGGDCGCVDLLSEWEGILNEDASPYMPDCFQWDGDNTDPEDEDEDGDITLDDDDIPVKNLERNQPCPKCGQPCKLTSLQVLVGYSCDRCMYGDSNDPGY